MVRVLPVVLAGLLAWGSSGVAHAVCAKGRATGVRGDTVVVGYSPGPPFVTEKRDGGVEGIAIDLLRTLAEQEGWQLSFVELSPESLRARLAACLLDVGVLGVAVRTSLIALGSANDPTLEISQPYLSTVTTVIVNEGDVSHAPTGRSRAGHFLRVAARGLVYGVAALALLAVASWLLNAFTGSMRSLRLRRIDATVSGPLAGLRWLLRSITGRVLFAVWLVIGIAIGATSAIGGTLLDVSDSDDALSALVARAAHDDQLIGERLPDGKAVTCEGGEERACFRGFADGTMSAIAGPREVLCMHALALSLDDTVLRSDLEIPEHFAYLLPPASPLRAHLDLALLRQHERSSVPTRPVRCPGDG
jgi:ABC-type amino acid transport substrate-binding protein